MSQVIDVSDTTFEAEVLQSEIPVLIDFWGPNCAPCEAMVPHVTRLAEDLAGKLKVVKMNVHDNMRTAMAYKVQAMPTFVVLRGGQEVNRQKGAQGGLVALQRLVEDHV